MTPREEKIFELRVGDCLEIMKSMVSNSIDVIVTSPPYFNLRDYGVDAQIGMEGSSDEYLDNLMEIFNEAYRILKPTGSCWVNIDDVYSNQSLSCIPDKFKIRMVEHGWLCRNEIIWHKPNAMPSSAKTRFNNDYEKFFFFTKSKKYYFETQYEPCKSVAPKSHSSKDDTSGKYQDINQESSVRQGMNKRRGFKEVYLRKNLPTQEEFVAFLRTHTNVDDIVNASTLKRSKVEHWFRRDVTGFSYPSVEDWNTIKHLVDDGSEEYTEID
ncbi:MAG: site-specific DNA-methyltransferase, partial [Bacteroidaceae bacterium]|nr:site-specific DNA-methyltransferase [Bacteroidaceae bacterium]